MALSAKQKGLNQTKNFCITRVRLF